jgi:hypothetical protein
MSIAAICIFAIGFLLFSSLGRAQASTEFLPETVFEIPAHYGVINFAFNGSYTQATFKNNSWFFSQLRLYNSAGMESLQVSVQNCNITIRSYGLFRSVDSAGILRYNVTGQGNQTFNFNLEPKEREWSVVFDGEYRPEGNGWNLEDHETITVTRAAVNVTIFYMGIPGDSNSNLSFYERHSVAISTGAVVTVVVVSGVFIRVKGQKTDKAEIEV